MNAGAMLLASLIGKLAEISAKQIAGAIDEAQADAAVAAAISEYQTVSADVSSKLATARRLTDEALASLPHRPVAQPAPVGGNPAGTP